jgi:hypothetical protein
MKQLSFWTKKYITGVSTGHLYPEDMAILEKI